MFKAIIFDYGRTVHDQESDRLFPGIVALLKKLKSDGIKLGLMSRAPDVEKRLDDFKRFSLDKYFDFLDVTPMFTKTGEMNSKNLQNILDKLEIKSKETLIVGDRIKSEIVEGNKIGATTIWVQQGKFKDETPESEDEKPNHTVNSIAELTTLLNSFF